ncbi:MAG: site-2 protease family protein [Spirulinaceae cyanobacterium]
MNNNIRVGNLFGIPFFINPSWFLVLGLVTLSFGGELAGFPQLSGLVPWILGLITALLLFASVLAHELGHSAAAIQQGISVKSITLFIFGGLASLERESKTPGEAFLVAIAGPLVSLLLFGLFTILALTTGVSGPLAVIINLLASINLVLALFNLLPGLPLDGGNILKALVWKVTGNPYKGVVFASRVGQFFGWLAVMVGGLAILGISPVGSFWTLLIGFFLLQNAGFSAQSANLQDKLNNLTAADAVIPNSPVISADLNLREFANNYVIGNGKWRKFLVTNEAEQLIGTVVVDDMKLVSTSLWPETSIQEVMKSTAETITVNARQSLLEVVQLLEQKEVQQLPVISENGTVVGLLEKASIMSLLQKQGQTNPA